ncbi:MAG: aminodeoxychorismate/anthranilate synthase component II [Thomasclavelia sp.]|jgi:anthranilate synthase component 2|nr:aminodeoxychorismate/anthranilate synthase component II [Thomasclavelia sp.]
MILLIDNYDSFAYNLYQLIGSINEDIKVIRNDELTIEEIKDLDPDYIIISPGPGKPSEAGIIEEVVKYFYDKKPILGVCLGHQAICEALGAKITYAKVIMHGKSSIISINDDKIFEGVSKHTKVARYHSLAVDESTLPSNLKVIARSDDNEVMAVKLDDYEVYGLQFHPESILTDEGFKIMNNFLGGKNND